MSHEQLPYQFNLHHEIGILADTNAVKLGGVEATHLARDIMDFGAIAVASEIATGIITDTQPTVAPNIVNPFQPEHLKPKRVYIDEEWKKTEKRSDPKLVAMDTAIQNDQAMLNRFSRHEMTGEELTRYLSANFSAARNPAQINSHEDISKAINSLDLPPYLRAVRGAYTYEDEFGEQRRGMPEHFFHLAGTPELTNFAQWYAGKLNEIAVPERRAAKIEEIKGGYLTGVDALIADGWISPNMRKAVAKNVKRAKIYFASPFSTEGRRGTGGHIRDGRTSKILLRVGGKKGVADHELTHAVGGVDVGKMVVANAELFSDESDEAQFGGALFLRTMLDEAFAVHMDQSINDGSPAIMSQRMRKANGLKTQYPPEFEVGGYGEMLEITSMLLEGLSGSGVIEQPVMRAFNDAMISRSYEDLSELIASRWGGEDMLREILRVAISHAATEEGDVDQWVKLDNPDINRDGKLSAKIKEMLAERQRVGRESAGAPVKIEELASV